MPSSPEFYKECDKGVKMALSKCLYFYAILMYTKFNLENIRPPKLQLSVFTLRFYAL